MYESFGLLSSRIEVQLQKLKNIIDHSIPKLNEMIKANQKVIIDTKVMD
jgi:hypothetical protein